MDLGLASRSTIITGGSGGIGRGLVLAFAAEGANVVIATRDGAKGQDVADAARDLPGDVLVVPTDVTRPEAVESRSRARRPSGRSTSTSGASTTAPGRSAGAWSSAGREAS